MKVTVTAKDVAKCVSFKPGDKFVVEKNEVLLGESDKVCSYALSSFFPSSPPSSKEQALRTSGSETTTSEPCAASTPAEGWSSNCENRNSPSP